MVGMAALLAGLSGCADAQVSFPPSPDAGAPADVVTVGPDDVASGTDVAPLDAATPLDARAPADAAVADARVNDTGVVGPGADAAAGCSLTGAWSFFVSGDGAFLVFETSGRWSLTYDPEDPKFTITSGTYRVTGDHLSLQEDFVDSVCDPSDVGEYVLRYEPSCDALSLGRVIDACGDRGSTLDGLELSRETL